MTARVAVFCGSSLGGAQIHEPVAQLAGLLAEQDICLVYGGGDRGLMGVMLKAFTTRSRRVISVTAPSVIADELLGSVTIELVTCETIADRVQAMVETSDGFLIAPGGLGTLEEFLIVASGRQLGVHKKPVVLFDPGDYWKPLLAQLTRAEDSFGYVDILSSFNVGHSPAETVELLLNLLGGAE